MYKVSHPRLKPWASSSYYCEKLVDVENNLETDVESTVSLEKNIGWDFQGSNEKSKLISKGQSEQFFVNTKGVSPSENRGNYTVKSVDGSFYISSIRTVEFISGGFEATVGSNSSVALIIFYIRRTSPTGVVGCFTVVLVLLSIIESKLIVTQSDGFKKQTLHLEPYPKFREFYVRVDDYDTYGREFRTYNWAGNTYSVGYRHQAILLLFYRY
jgi:hypothetical protein